MVALDKSLYVFSGRGGTKISALQENGSLWTFTPSTSTWSFLKPADPDAPYPEARSYHSATSDGESKIFIHAGCSASGRLLDFWSFDIRLKAWTKLPDAPGPERGGTSLCFAASKVWRMGGFDGKEEIGGSVDSFDLASSKWESFTFRADGSNGPGARSVAALLPLAVAGKHYLVTLLGEADPSRLGHAGAGKMLEDGWAFDLDERTWSKLETSEVRGGKPAPRGWFGSTAVEDHCLAVVGGLGEDNERLNDVWTLEFV
jgi:N-acetylneuraminic acid mutarotase